MLLLLLSHNNMHPFNLAWFSLVGPLPCLPVNDYTHQNCGDILSDSSGQLLLSLLAYISVLVVELDSWNEILSYLWLCPLKTVYFDHQVKLSHQNKQPQVGTPTNCVTGLVLPTVLM